jgi:hypothetical protein
MLSVDETSSSSVTPAVYVGFRKVTQNIHRKTSHRPSGINAVVKRIIIKTSAILTKASIFSVSPEQMQEFRPA